WHRTVRLLPIIDLFEDDDRARIDFHSQLVVRSHDRERARNRLWTVRWIKRYRSSQHHVLHAAKLLATLCGERRFREFHWSALGRDHDCRRRGSVAITRWSTLRRRVFLCKNGCAKTNNNCEGQNNSIHFKTLSINP